jgi:hypothetical protein
VGGWGCLREWTSESRRLTIPVWCGVWCSGKKFNARKEDVIGEDYLGLRIFRFYIKCTSCSAEIVFKTDPKNSDYVCEAGAQRNFEPWRQAAATDEEVKAQKEEEEKNDAMRKLENRSVASKREVRTWKGGRNFII